MEVAQAVHMKGGPGDASYGNQDSMWDLDFFSNSPPHTQHSLGFDTKKKSGSNSTLKTSSRGLIVTSLCSTLPRSLTIADLGCSFGPNTLLVVSELIKTVEKLCRELNHKSLEYKAFFNDLPGNDFNNLFMSLNIFKENLCDKMKTRIGPCYFFGAPDSFYDMLFPNRSLHFVHSSYTTFNGYLR
uniref:Uncharacterized protein n=1 Tax=Glycine max TaxID=3847 RepID=K7MH58_SOYBN